MDIFDLFSDSNTAKRNHKNVVLVDVSYFAQRAFHGYFRSNEKVCHVSMRYTLLKTLLDRFNRMNINSHSHQIVMCYDSRNYWQTVSAPYYKCRRKLKREKSKDKKDWEGFSESMASLRKEFVEYFPFTVMMMDDISWTDKETNLTHSNGMEADDVIGILAKRLTSEGKNVTVMTGDGDFTQLDYLPNLKIIGFDGKPAVPEYGCGYYDLLHKIINGDDKDDVANVNMRSNYWATKMEKEQQTSAKSLAREACSVDDPMSVLNEEQKKRFIENRSLKDFNYIPQDLVDAVNQEFTDYQPNPISKVRELFHYLKQNDMIIQDSLVDLIEKVL